MGIRVFIVGYEMECEKLVFNKTKHSSDSTLLLERVASLSSKLTTKPDCTFCSIVLQLL